MYNIYKYIDLSLSRNELPKTKNNIKSRMGSLISLAFLVYCIIHIIKTIKNSKKNFSISFNEIFLDEIDNEQNITFGFKINNANISYEILDSNDKKIPENLIKLCDENLNEIKTDNIIINNYTCFINRKFRGSNTTNHLMKLHFFSKNNTFIKDEERIQLSIKFKEPIINHENYDNPFVFPKAIKEYNYFYDVGYITRYAKYIKIISYNTDDNSFPLLPKSIMIQSIFMEDMADSSKVKGKEYFDETLKLNQNKTEQIFIGTFRLVLSKKKDIFIREYPDLLTSIGGHLVTIYGIVGIIYIIFVRHIDNIRIYDYIKNEPYMKMLNTVINRENDRDRDFTNYNDEVCCCCCSCCFDYNENNQENNLIIHINNYNLEDITCVDKWHYFFYKISRYCCKKKPEKNKDSCCRTFLKCLCFIICLPFAVLYHLFCFCEGCTSENDNDNVNCITRCKNCFEGIFCCCKNDEKNKTLRRIDEYLEQHSDAVNYFELIANKENMKLNPQ